MKYQNLFSGKNKKNITNLLSAELAKRVVKVKLSFRTSVATSQGVLIFTFYKIRELYMSSFVLSHFRLNKLPLYTGVHFQFKVSQTMRFTYSKTEMIKLFANNGYPDQTLLESPD